MKKFLTAIAAAIMVMSMAGQAQANYITIENNGKVPVRDVLEQAGGVVEWNSSSNTAYLWHNGIQVVVVLNSIEAEKNGETVMLQNAAALEQGSLVLAAPDFEALFDVTLRKVEGQLVINASSYNQTGGWKRSSPEEQGMNSDVLAQMLEKVKEENIPLDSLLILKNGYLVSETYFYPYQAQTLHAVNSCTKSVLSALCGIAIEQGYLSGVDQRVADFYPELFQAEEDGRREQLTVEHLLTLTAGLNTMNDIDYQAFLQAQDRPLFVLSQPFAETPGEAFRYDNWATHVLAGVLNRATGMDLEDYAQQVLFGPLGITHYQWTTDNNGLHTGGYGLSFLPEDMLKIGYLYLREGKWNGQQIIPKEWVRESVMTKVDAGGGKGYGYLWWTGLAEGVYYAHGYGGQYILVMPQEELVVAMTSHFSDNDRAEAVFQQLMTQFVFPAIQETKGDSESLKQLQQQIAIGESHPVAAYPPTAQAISGTVYTIQEKSGLKQIQLWFARGVCTVSLNDELIPVGMDGRYRFSQKNPNVGWMGQWTDYQEFQLIRRDLTNLEQQTFSLQFAEKKVQIVVRQQDGQIITVLTGEKKGVSRVN